MIDGLKLRMTGLELKTRLDARIRRHARDADECAERLQAIGETDSDALTRQRQRRRVFAAIARAQDEIEVLTLIRDHISADEVYQLGELDLRFADLLPERDDWLDCDCLGPAASSGTDPGLFDDAPVDASRG
jgi:hypothetical protein